MDFIKDTLYTQTMYAEFERDVQVRKGGFQAVGVYLVAVE